MSRYIDDEGYPATCTCEPGVGWTGYPWYVDCMNTATDKLGRFAVTQSSEDRFWSWVRRGDGCWEWQGTRNHGYGAYRVTATRRTGAHRYSWELANGPVPRGLCVLHRCDNPPCVRPDHLFLGTTLDNNRDMQAKGRRARPNVVLTPEQVREIRVRVAAGESMYSQSRRLKVATRTVRDIIQGLTWTWLT